MLINEPIPYNHSPDFWNTPHANCNCGSFAFDLTEWYCPYDDYDDRLEFIQEMADQGYSKQDILSELLLIDSDFLIKEFNGKLELIEESQINDFDKNEVIIAYRLGLEIGCVTEDIFEPEDLDIDFHFKVRHLGYWEEKSGANPVRMCELDPDKSWYSPDHFEYDSKILYFHYLKDN